MPADSGPSQHQGAASVADGGLRSGVHCDAGPGPGRTPAHGGEGDAAEADATLPGGSWRLRWELKRRAADIATELEFIAREVRVAVFGRGGEILCGFFRAWRGAVWRASMWCTLVVMQAARLFGVSATELLKVAARSGFAVLLQNWTSCPPARLELEVVGRRFWGTAQAPHTTRRPISFAGRQSVGDPLTP